MKLHQVVQEMMHKKDKWTLKVVLLFMSVHTMQNGSTAEKKLKETRMISGSHGCEYEDGCLLGCSAVWTGMSLPTFRRSVLSPS
jgi:hypothetical protein